MIRVIGIKKEQDRSNIQDNVPISPLNERFVALNLSTKSEGKKSFPLSGNKFRGADPREQRVMRARPIPSDIGLPIGKNPEHPHEKLPRASVVPRGCSPILNGDSWWLLVALGVNEEWEGEAHHATTFRDRERESSLGVYGPPYINTATTPGTDIR